MSGPARRVEQVVFEIYDATILSCLILGHLTVINLSQVLWEGYERRQAEAAGDIAKAVDEHGQVSLLMRAARTCQVLNPCLT